MTRYVFHYDLESDTCIKAAPVLVELHRKHDIPATFFLLGITLEKWGKELRAIFEDDPLFDLESHTYSHRMLKDNLMHGLGVSLEELKLEVKRGIQLVEDIFERPCIGVRTGCGFYNGFRGEKERLQVIWDCGVRFFSSDLRGPGDSIPAGLVQAYWYDEEGFPDLLELPGHGWHDNVLKEFGAPFRLMLPWPLVVQWGIPNRPVQTPEEEFEVQKVWIDRAITLNLDYISLVYHPHSIYRMSEDCRVIQLLMKYVLDRGMPTMTYRQLYEHYRQHRDEVPGRNAWTWESEIAKAPLKVGIG